MSTAMTLRGRVALIVLTLVVAACGGSPATAHGSPDTGIRGTVTAGPVCPVERNPPDPSCAPRPVAGATIVIRDGSGAQVAVAISGADGGYLVALPAGDYILDPQPVQGLLGTAPRTPTTVAAGVVSNVPLEYDTGIR